MGSLSGTLTVVLHPNLHAHHLGFFRIILLIVSLGPSVKQLGMRTTFLLWLFRHRRCSRSSSSGARAEGSRGSHAAQKDNIENGLAKKHHDAGKINHKKCKMALNPCHQRRQKRVPQSGSDDAHRTYPKAPRYAHRRASDLREIGTHSSPSSKHRKMYGPRDIVQRFRGVSPGFR